MKFHWNYYFNGICGWIFGIFGVLALAIGVETETLSLGGILFISLLGLAWLAIGVRICYKTNRHRRRFLVHA